MRRPQFAADGWPLTKTHRRVLLLASSPNLLGGAEHCLVDVVTAMAATDWDPIVAVPSEGTLADALRKVGVGVVTVPMGVLRHRGEARSPVLLVRLAVAGLASLRLARIIRTRDIDVVHSNTAGVLAGGLAARWAGVPHVWHVREILHGPAWPPLRRSMFALSDRIVCISSCVAEHVCRRSEGNGKVVVVRDGIDLGLFSPGSDAAEVSTRVVMFSRIHPAKGHEEFVRAAALVAGRLPDPSFAMIGGCLPVYESLRQQIDQLIRDLGLSRRIALLPGVSRQEAAGILRRAAVAVVPSTWVEPGGLVVLEAMASGLPVIASDRGGPSEVITDGVDGFLVSPADTARMGATLEQLLADPAYRRQVGERARRRVEEFSLDRNVNRLTEIYSDVITARHGVIRAARWRLTHRSKSQ